MKDGWENFTDPEQAKLSSAQFLVDQALAEESLNSAYAIHCLRQAERIVGKETVEQLLHESEEYLRTMEQHIKNLLKEK